MDLPRARPPAALLGLGPLDALEAPLLLGQRRLELLVLVVLLEALGRDLLLGRGEDGLAEVLAAQLAHEREPRRREKHLLADLGDVRDVRHRREPGDRGVPLEEDVHGVGVGQGGEDELGDVLGEGGRGGGGRQQADGHEGLILDGGEEPEVGVGLEELVELGVELLGSCREGREGKLSASCYVLGTEMVQG